MLNIRRAVFSVAISCLLAAGGVGAQQPPGLSAAEGYDKPPEWMERGKMYNVTVQPLTTSNYFAPGHRLRIEVSSSNFPRFDRNLNTGGNNYDETTGVVAHNAVHHSKQYPSQLTITVVKRPAVPESR